MNSVISDKREMIELPSRGGAISVRRWRGERPRLLFAHATGLCASAYRQTLRNVAPYADIIAPDIRGHGRTQLPSAPEPLRSWDVFADDLAALFDTQEVPAEGWHLAGHSMGAVSALLLAARAQVKVASLTMIEPVMIPTFLHVIARSPFQPLIRQFMPLSRQAASRRARFASRDAALANYHRKPFFRNWAAGALEDYLEDGLTLESDDTEAAVRLSCDPEWEAATFSAQGSYFWWSLNKVLADVTRNVFMIYAEKRSTAPMFARQRLEKMGIPSISLQGSSHMMPVEQPKDCAELLMQRITGALI